MKCPKKYNNPMPLKILAEGHCMSVENAIRLIDDGEILIKSERYLGAINSLMLAVEELAKANLIDQAVAYDPSEKDKWEWFWNAFESHKEKLRLMEYQFHWKSYQDREEFHRRVNFLLNKREESVYVQFDVKKEKFLMPEQVLGFKADIKESAINEFKYVLALLKFFVFAGMPTPRLKLKAYVVAVRTS